MRGVETVPCVTVFICLCSCARVSLKNVIAIRKPLSVKELTDGHPCKHDNVGTFSRSPHCVLYQRTHMGKDNLNVFCGEIISFIPCII